jgi:hypothetical protein
MAMPLSPHSIATASSSEVNPINQLEPGEDIEGAINAGKSHTGAHLIIDGGGSEVLPTSTNNIQHRQSLGCELVTVPTQHSGSILGSHFHAIK